MSSSHIYLYSTFTTEMWPWDYAEWYRQRPAAVAVTGCDI